MKRILLLLIAPVIAVASCNTRTETQVVDGTAVDHGRALFSDRSASSSPLNRFSCATCHPIVGSSADRIFPGASLAGAPKRTSFWQGQENDLLTAINDCRSYFMDATDPWTTNEENAKAMYAYLTSLPSTDLRPIAFTVVQNVVEVLPSDRAQGEGVYRRACQTCHGDLHTGNGRMAPLAPTLPDDVLADHQEYPLAEQRLVFVEKVRHGGFLGYGGTMPPFSLEVLTDADLSALVAYLEVYR